MTEQEFRKKCKLKPNELISTNRGLADIFGIGKDPETGEEKVALGFLASGKIITESVESVIEKLAGLSDKKGEKNGITKGIATV